MKTTPKSKKSNKAGKVIAIIVIVIAACVFCFAGYKIVTIMVNYNESESSYDNIRKILINPDTPADETETSESGGSGDEADTDLPVEYEDEYDEGMTWNYQALLAVNSDTIGYIKARGDGSIVDYPIVQTDNNDYYLDHLFDGTANDAGTIFMDTRSSLGFDSPYSVIYGHNMKSGSRMFGYIKQYDSEEYYSSHTEYDIYTANAHYVYKVVSVMEVTTDELPYTTPLYIYSDSMSEEEIDSAIGELAAYVIYNSKYDTGYKPEDFDHNSHLLTLSTCYDRGQDNRRYIVVLTRDRVVINR